MHVQTRKLKSQEVVFGRGARHQLDDHIQQLGCARAMVLSTPGQSNMAMTLTSSLNGHVAGVYTRAAMHTPTHVTQDALAHATEIGADCFVAIGGGSTIGLSKALALRTGKMQIAIPTTYAGSEATPILGQTEAGLKTTLTDPSVMPEVVIYDPELVVSLPAPMTVASGLNAMAHAAEALYAKDRSDASNARAIEGLEAFRASLPKVVSAPDDLDAREATQRGAYACGAVLGHVGMALHHKLCHTLGGSFDLPHAQTHAIVLPHAIQFNTVAAPDLLAPITDIFGGTEPGGALWAFAKGLKAPLALKDLGLQEENLDKAAEIALSKPYWNPREVTKDGIRALLQNAWAGRAPGS